MNFVFVSLQQIDTDRTSTSIGLAKELSKTHNVLYVNYPLDRNVLYFKEKTLTNTLHIERRKEKIESLVQISSNLWVLWPNTILESINWLPSTLLFQAANWINNKRFAEEIKTAIDKLNFSSFYIINDKDIFRSFYLKELLNPEKYIYLDRDYTIGIKYWRKHGFKLEPKLMQKADLVVCNSRAFTQRAKNYNKNSFYIGNGFDIDHYNVEKQHIIPCDLKDIPTPRIGYVGALITLRLNLNLLIEIAKAKPNWSYVFVGPEDMEFKKSELHCLPNVFFLGKKHTNDIPSYINNFDVCINPQLINDITDNNFPLKILEYLALGKPVVATSTTTMREEFAMHTYLANDKENFIHDIECSLEENNPQYKNERILFANKYSWGNVINKLLDSIRKSQIEKK